MSLEYQKELWTKLCPGVDEVLEEYAKEVDGKVENWVENTPSRVLTWQRTSPFMETPLSLSISILLQLSDESALRVYAASWSDDETALKRNSLEIAERFIPTPVMVPAARSVIRTYGHILRMFSCTENGLDLHREILKLAGPRQIQFHVTQTDIPIKSA